MKNTLVKGIAATALTGGALALGTGMANAAPVKPAKPSAVKSAHSDPYRVSAAIAPGVTYTGDTKQGAAKIVTPWGTISTAKGQWAVADTKGRAVYGNPKATAMKPSTARPTSSAGLGVPQMAGAATPSNGKPAAKKKLTFAEKEEAVYSAIGNVGTHFGLAYGVGAMIGGVAGGVVGCPIGAIAMAPTAFTGPIGPILGCVIGIGTIGTTGAILGGAAVATPVGIISAGREIQRLSTDGVFN